MLQAPALLLHYSLGAFLVGFGIYLGFIAADHLCSSTDKGFSFAVLGVYTAVTVATVLLFQFLAMFKELELAPIRRWQTLLDTRLGRASSHLSKSRLWNQFFGSGLR
ncbi:hypothetical protein BDW71DRAFT_183740 [Aspergillus fruticulosus]